MADEDHYSKAERLTRGKPSSFHGKLDPPDADDVALAHVHAALAVADRLDRLTEALQMLIQVQQERR